MAISHADCTHPRTPAGRRACRATTNSEKYTEIREAAANARGIERDRQRAQGRLSRSEKPVRIQPRRSGARVAAQGSACVQAALHIDAHGGRCACGWEAKVA